MTLPQIDAGRARDLIARFAELPVLVVGDAMIDRFIVGRVTRISPEAPVPIVRFESEHVRLGGAEATVLFEAPVRDYAAELGRAEGGQDWDAVRRLEGFL